MGQGRTSGPSGRLWWILIQIQFPPGKTHSPNPPCCGLPSGLRVRNRGNSLTRGQEADHSTACLVNELYTALHNQTTSWERPQKARTVLKVVGGGACGCVVVHASAGSDGRQSMRGFSQGEAPSYWPWERELQLLRREGFVGRRGQKGQA